MASEMCLLAFRVVVFDKTGDLFEVCLHAVFARICFTSIRTINCLRALYNSKSADSKFADKLSV